MSASEGMLICWILGNSITGTTAAANATLSLRGIPGPLSRSGSIPATEHKPAPRRHVSGGISPTYQAAVPYPIPTIVEPVICSRNPGTLRIPPREALLH